MNLKPKSRVALPARRYFWAFVTLLVGLYIYSPVSILGQSVWTGLAGDDNWITALNKLLTSSKRMGRDSNPRYLAVHTLSRRAQSTALAPIRNEPTSLVSIDRSCNPFVTPATPRSS
jgi:hypothetical protein